MRRLLEVKGGVLDSLADTVLALDGVAGHGVLDGLGLGLLGAGKLCELRQSFGRRGRDSSDGCRAAGRS